VPGVDPRIDEGQLAEDPHEILFGTREIVIPGGVHPAESPAVAGSPAQPYKGEPSVVLGIDPPDAGRPPILTVQGHRREQDREHDNPHAHGVIIALAKVLRVLQNLLCYPLATP